MLVPDATEPVPAALELTLHLTVLSGLLMPVTEALNWTDLPLSTDWFEARTDTPVTVGISTVTEAMPDFDVSMTDVAITYKVVKNSLGDIVSSPLELMFVPAVTAPEPSGLELTLHVTVSTGSFIPVTIALNRKVLPLTTDWNGGLTFTFATTGISTVTAALPLFVGSSIEKANT